MGATDAQAEARLREALRRTEEVTRSRARTGRGHDDADDVEGTIGCDDAIGFDPLPLLGAFDQHGARVVIIGQVAGILHGSAELTGDLDLLWSGHPGEAAAVGAAFAAVDASLSDDDGAPLALEPEAFELPKLQFHTATAAGDCCTPDLPWGRLDVAGFLERADSALVNGVRVHYVRRDDLIAMRLAVGREKDLRRAEELQRLRA